MIESPNETPAPVPGIRYWIPWMFQVVLLGVVAFVPFGFDRPSSAGLDFDDFIAVAVLFCLVGVGTAIGAITGRRWGLLAAEIVLAMTGVWIVLGK